MRRLWDLPSPLTPLPKGEENYEYRNLKPSIHLSIWSASLVWRFARNQYRRTSCNRWPKWCRENNSREAFEWVVATNFRLRPNRGLGYEGTFRCETCASGWLRLSKS